MVSIFVKEFNSFLDSLIGYVVVAIFLVAMGLFMWVFPDTSVLEYGFADMDTLFSLGPYVFIFLVPAITMRSLAEEKKLGTLELLMTKPLTEWHVVLGKFFACFLLVIIAVAPTSIYYFSLSTLGSPAGNIDTPGVIGSYVGLILLGGVFCSVGVFTSAITPNQIVSFLLAAFLCFALYSVPDLAASLIGDGALALWTKQAGMLYHYESMSKGVIDSRDVVYFFSITAVALLATRTVLSSRTW